MTLLYSGFLSVTEKKKKTVSHFVRLTSCFLLHNFSPLPYQTLKERLCCCCLYSVKLPHAMASLAKNVVSPLRYVFQKRKTNIT